VGSPPLMALRCRQESGLAGNSGGSRAHTVLEDSEAAVPCRWAERAAVARERPQGERRPERVQPTYRYQLHQRDAV